MSLTYESPVLENAAMTAASPVRPTPIRHDLRPGDLGTVTAFQGSEYAEQYGLDHTFEAQVARGVGDFGMKLAADPEAGRLWIAEDGEGILGCVAVSRESEELARLRWFLVRRAARGQGLGRRLLEAALDYTRERGFPRLELVTFSELRAAAHLYDEAGFELLSATPQPLWGRELELRHYELTL